MALDLYIELCCLGHTQGDRCGDARWCQTVLSTWDVGHETR